VSLPAAPREIVVRGPNWAGDLVMSTPGFRALRAGFPRARITLHVRSGLEALVAGAPWFDRVLPLGPGAHSPLALLRAARALAAAGPFDLGLCIPDSFSSALLMRLARVGCSVGYERGGRGLLLQHALPVPSEWGPRRLVAREHCVLGLVEALGCTALGTHLELYTTPEEEERAKVQIRARAAGARLVGLAPGAGYGPAKCWPAERYAQVGDALGQAGAQVVLLGAQGEAALTAEVAARMREPALDLGGRLDLGAAKAVIRQLALLVCNDAGARHIAVAFGVPCVVFFGPTSVAKTNENLGLVRVLETDAACRPCYRRRCPIDHRCMTGIAPERAVEAALQLWLARERPGAAVDGGGS
jgi:heptosyltransferase II